MRKSKIIFLIFLATLCGKVMAAGQKSQILLDYKAIENINNKASLQRGAKYFVNYCSGCHSLKYMRMNTLAKDLGIEEEIFIKNLVFFE